MQENTVLTRITVNKHVHEITEQLLNQTPEERQFAASAEIVILVINLIGRWQHWGLSSLQ